MSIVVRSPHGGVRFTSDRFVAPIGPRRLCTRCRASVPLTGRVLARNPGMSLPFLSEAAA